MAYPSGSSSPFIPKQMHLSLVDLSMEFKSLGLKPLAISKCDSFSELSEALLCSTWTLVNLVHGRAMGFTETNQYASDREAMLRSEKQSLEIKIENFKCEIDNQTRIICKERENARQLEEKLKRRSEELQQEKLKSSQLESKIETLEKDMKHEIFKQQTEMEHLRNIIRKSLGVSQRQQTVTFDRIGCALETLTVSEMATKQQTELQQSTLNRLKSVNHTLVGENLMLRDALRMLHNDINHILIDLEVPPKDAGVAFPLPDNIFNLPLSYSMSKLQEIRREQLYHLNAILKSL